MIKICSLILEIEEFGQIYGSTIFNLFTIMPLKIFSVSYKHPHCCFQNPYSKPGKYDAIFYKTIFREHQSTKQ